MVKEYRLHVISHTHWDREWCFPFQKFRLKLVNLIDHLMKILDNDPYYKYFMLDGQTIVLEDYLEIKPQNKNKLRRFIKEDRIFVGPWYIQPDEFLVSGEATIRNLMLGYKIAKEFGRVMKVGYLPDCFGHMSQMPQILTNFGINSAVIWRGISGESEKLKSEFYWQSPDGTKVLTHHLTDRYGYGNVRNLSGNTEEALKKIKMLKEELIPFATTPHLLLMIGGDNMEPHPGLSRIIKQVNEHLDDAELIHSNLPDYFKKLQSESYKLKTIPGEFRDTNRSTTGEGNFILTGVLSTRMYLKQRNEMVQSALEKWAEPFSAFAWTLTKEYPEEFLWQAWKYLLQNHPHDNIGGCHIDPVHNHMETKFSWAQDIADDISGGSLKAIVDRIDTSNLKDKDEYAIIVFNPLNWRRSDLTETVLDFPKEVDLKSLILKDNEGRNITCYIKEVEAAKGIFYNPYHIPTFTFPDIKRATIFFIAEDVPPCGYKTYTVKLMNEEQKINDLLVTGLNKMENEYLKITINNNGTLTIFDKETKVTYQNLHHFEDGGDAGDELIYSFPQEDKVIDTLKKKAVISLENDSSIYATFKVEIELDIPESLTADRKKRSPLSIPCKIISYITLSRGTKRVDIKTIVENEAKDHRLRVLFPSNIRTDYSYAEGQFDVVKRKIKVIQPRKECWIEDAPCTHPQQSFVDVNNGRHGLTIINKGLPEYEVKDDKERTIALTLLRCVGWLGVDDALTVKQGIGPHLPTPGAQCLGQYTFRYSILPHVGTWEQARVWQEAHQYNVPMRVVQTDSHRGALPQKLSFISVKPEDLIVTAIKKAEKKNVMVIRLYNVSHKEVKGKIEVYRKIKDAYSLGLNEEEKEELELNSNNSLSIKVGSKKIITLGLSI